MEMSCAPAAVLLPAPLQSQLLRDMQHWAPRSIRRTDILESAPESDTRATVAIVNRTVFWLRRYQGRRNALLDALVQDLVLLAATYETPDVVLNLNAFDEPVAPLRARPAPVFSFFQTRAAADILVPDSYFRTLGFDRLPPPDYYRDRYPWAAKRACAIWRGSLFCGPNRFLKCSRLVVAHLTDQNASELLDVRFTTYNPAHDVVRAEYLQYGDDARADLRLPPRPLQTASRVPIPEHAACQFTVHLDGFTGSSRLQLLLSLNSVVLKQDSYFWSYFSSALRPREHYLPFWEASPSDILSVLSITSRTDRAHEMGRLAERASELARTLLSRRARSLYWLVLLRMYARRLRSAPASWLRSGDATPAAPPAARRGQRDHMARRGPRGRTAESSACDDERTRREDEVAVGRLARRLDETLLQHAGGSLRRVRLGAARVMPEGGEASLPLAFESDAERRAMPPELDHAQLQSTRDSFAKYVGTPT